MIKIGVSLPSYFIYIGFASLYVVFPPEGTLHLFNLMCSLPYRPVNEEAEPSEVDAAGRWRGVYVNRTSPAPSDSATTVKSLIKSFDLGHSGILQNCTFTP